MYCRSCRKWFPNNILFCDICGKPYYDPRQGSFTAWFNALVRNRIYDYGRKLAGNREILPETSQQYFKEITDRNVYINPEARIEYAEREQILDEILDDIGEGQRICIQMYYNDGLKIKEIAQILNISEGTVKSRIHAVQKKITEHYTMPELWLGKTFYRMRQWLLEIKLPELKWLEEIKML